MNVVFTLVVDWRHHVGTEMELMQKHLDAGDSVTVLACFGDVPGCVTNIHNTRRRCLRCMQQRFEPLALLSKPVKLVSLKSYLSRSDYQAETELDQDFESVQQAQDFSFDQWDVGYAAYSTTIQNFRDMEISSAEAQKAWRRLLVSGFRSYRATTNYIVRNPDVDRFYVFNGRFALDRGVLRACQHHNIDVFVHERGCNSSKYSIFKNHLPMDRAPFLEKLHLAWSEADPSTRETVGAEFFERRRKGIADDWISFTKPQKAGRLPESWNPEERNLVIFTSSEDEFIGVGKEWHNPIYPSQGKAIEQIVCDLKNDPIKLYVRMHPNLKGVDNEDTRRTLALGGKTVEIIPPESTVSTYDLIDHAEKVITFGSTVGIEATYWGTPSVLAGHSFYRDLNGTYNSASHEETLQLLRQQLKPKAKIEALKYGFYLRTFGYPFEFYTADDFNAGSFNGESMFTAGKYTLPLLLIPLIARLFRSQPRVMRFLTRVVRLLHAPTVMFSRRNRQHQSVQGGFDRELSARKPI